MRKKKIDTGNLIIHIFFCVLCLLMLYPFWCVISASLVSTEEIYTVGFNLWPNTPSLDSYTALFQRIGSVLKAYGTTIFVAVVGSFFGVLVSAAYAYSLSRKSFPIRRILAFIATFTMYFSGGMAASYIIIVNVLKLKNSLLVLILPGAFNIMQMVVIRSFFDNLPYALIESAKLDGANEYTIFFRIMLDDRRNQIIELSCSSEENFTLAILYIFLNIQCDLFGSTEILHCFRYRYTKFCT